MWDNLAVYHRDPGETGRARIESLSEIIEDTFIIDQSLPINHPIKFLEIGVFQGDVAEHLLEAYLSMEYTGIDPWCSQPEAIYKDDANNQSLLSDAEMLSRNRTARFGDRCNLVKGFSANVAPTIDDKFFDVVYIDGNHSTEAVVEDITLWLPKCRRVLCGHDFAPGWCSVMDGVLIASQRLKFEVEICWPKSSVWFAVLGNKI